jgi:hypothetical protein
MSNAVKQERVRVMLGKYVGGWTEKVINKLGRYLTDGVVVSRVNRSEQPRRPESAQNSKPGASNVP